jgi:hypothetical protein
MKNSEKIYLCLLACLLAIPLVVRTVPAVAVHDGTVAEGGVFIGYSTANGAFLAIEGMITIAKRTDVNTLSIPSTERLKIVGEGTIHVAAGGTLTINGPFEAPLRWVFTGPGRVVFSLSFISRVIPGVVGRREWC